MGGRHPSAAAALGAVAVLLASSLFGISNAAAPEGSSLGTDVPPGHITAPVIWTAAGSPYRILGTVIIDAGVTVRVQAGAVVSPLAGVAIFVDGALIIEGSATLPVRVNSTGPSWSGIQYNASTLVSTAHNTSVRDALVPFTIIGGTLVSSNLTLTGASTGILARDAALTLTDATVTSGRTGIDADRSQLLLERIAVTAGNGADATSTVNATDGSTALLIFRSGVAGSKPGPTMIGNSSFRSGGGGANWFADRRAGDGGPAMVVRGSYGVSAVNISAIGGAGGNNSGSASSFASARAGDGGAAIIVDDSNETLLYRGGDVRGGQGGPTSSPSPSRAGDGGAGVLIGPNRSHNTTVFSFDAYAGDGGHATGLGVHPGDGGPAIFIIKGDDNLISSVRSFGGRGGDGSPSNGSGGRGGHGLFVVEGKRVFYYVVTLQGGRGGDTRIASTEPAGEGGDGLRLVYAETLFSELGYLLGGRGGDNHHASGAGGGKGGAGARIFGGRYRVEIGEADVQAGEGGDNHNATSGIPGRAAESALNITGGLDVLIEFSRIIPALGGRDFTGGPNGTPGNGIFVSADTAWLLVASVDGIAGVTPVCAHVSNATNVLFSGNSHFRCKTGLLVDSPVGGKVANVTSRSEYMFETETGAHFRAGATGTVVEMNVDNATHTGVKIEEGATPQFDQVRIHSSGVTNDSVLVAGGARPHFLNSEIAGSRVNDYRVSGDSHLTFENTKHTYGKGVVSDTSTVTVKNRLQFKAVDSRFSPMPRGDVEVYDNSTTVFKATLKKGGGCAAGGLPCDLLMTDRVHRSSGMWENRTSIAIIYKTWTFVASPGPVDDINMSTSHFEWLIGSGISPPRVNWTAPKTNATGVPPGSRIQISFTALMNESSVESSLKMTAPGIGGFDWLPDNRTLEFSALPWLMPDTTYTVVLNGSVAKDTLGFYLDGNRDGENQGSPYDDYDFSFTTASRPTLKLLGNGSAPGNVSQGEALVPFLILDYIAVGAPLLADTLEVEMYGTATETDVASIGLWKDANGNARFDLADVNLGWKKFSFGKASFSTSSAISPNRPDHFFVVLNISQDALIDACLGVQIASESSVSVTGANVSMPVKPLRSGLGCIVGDLIPPQVVSFVPTGLAVPLDSSMAVGFSEPMNWTATKASFILTPAQPFNVNLSGNGAIIDPIAPLRPATQYTLKVSGSGARDRAGNLLDGNRNGISEGSPNDDFSFTFTTETPQGATVKGKIVDDLGNPIAGALVKATLVGSNSTFPNVTDADGSYEIRVLLKGTATVDLVASKTAQVSNSSRGLSVGPGDLRWVNLTLPDDVGSVRVTVLGESGAPIPGAVVELIGTALTGTTDGVGQVLFTRVPVGNYTARALKSGFAEVSGEVKVLYRVTADLKLRLVAPPDLTPLIAAAIAAAVALVAAAYLFLRWRKARQRSLLPKLEKTDGKPDARSPTEPAPKQVAKAAAEKLAAKKGTGGPK